MPNIRHSLDPIAKRLKLEVEDLFIKFHLGSQYDFFEILAGKPVWGTEQQLLPRDLALLLVLTTQVHPMTGRINCSVSELARKCGKTLSQVQISISRLKKARMLVNTRDKSTGGLYMLLNPALVSVGSEKGGKRQKLYANFYSVLENELRPEEEAVAA